jgi:hypothetical protein
MAGSPLGPAVGRNLQFAEPAHERFRLKIVGVTNNLAGMGRVGHQVPGGGSVTLDRLQRRTHDVLVVIQPPGPKVMHGLCIECAPGSVLEERRPCVTGVLAASYGERSRNVTERVGFEPTVPGGTPVFETSPFSHSGTSPASLLSAEYAGFIGKARGFALSPVWASVPLRPHESGTCPHDLAKGMAKRPCPVSEAPAWGGRHSLAGIRRPAASGRAEAAGGVAGRPGA